MLMNTYEFLHFANFKDIPNWSVQYADEVNLGFTNKYPLVCIGSFLHKSRDIIEVQDNVEYKQVTIKINNGGVVPRNDGATLKGSKIGTKRQYVVHTGQFIMSRIDARNGAYGIVPEELEGAIVTNDFPVFYVDNDKIIPQFLVLVSTTDKFVDFARKCSSGTTNRKRIEIETFLQQQIPLPSIKEQEEILSKYNVEIVKALNLENNIRQTDLGIEDYFKKILGVTTKQEKLKNGNRYSRMMFVNFLDVSEWGIDLIKKKQKRDFFRYPILKIKDICQLGSGGTPSRSCSQYYNGIIPWVKTGEVLNDVITETEEHITEEAITNSSAKLYPKGSLIIAMYGQGDTRGRTAKLGIDATTNQACAVLYDINNCIVSTDYLWYYLQGRYHDLRSMASGNNQPNLNAAKIKKYDVVVPPMDVQNEMVSYIKEQKALAKLLKQKAKEIKDKASIEFENEIFE